MSISIFDRLFNLSISWGHLERGILCDPLCNPLWYPLCNLFCNHVATVILIFWFEFTFSSHLQYAADPSCKQSRMMKKPYMRPMERPCNSWRCNSKSIMHIIVRTVTYSLFFVLVYMSVFCRNHSVIVVCPTYVWGG